jgi:crossover junction endodeoxyribonuclease RuvC
MKILGIDPGTATTGFGVIEKRAGKLTSIDYGVISTKKSLPMHLRLNIIFQDLTELIKNHKPEVIAVEKLFFVKNITTGISVGQARGVVLLAAAQADLELIEFTPLQVKMSVTGYGQASKRQVQEMVAKILQLKTLPHPDDAADALAIAICAASSTKF